MYDADEYDREKLPLASGLKEIRQVRLDWSKTVRESTHNSAIMDEMVEWAIIHGGDLVSGVKAQLEKMSKPDVRVRFVKKFDGYRKVWRDTEHGKGKSQTRAETIQHNNRAKSVSLQSWTAH